MKKGSDKLLIVAGIAVVGIVAYEMLKPKTVATTPTTPTGLPTGVNPLTGAGQSIWTALLGSGGAASGISTVSNWLSNLFGAGSGSQTTAGSNVADPTYNTPYIPPGAYDYPGIDLSSQDQMA